MDKFSKIRSLLDEIQIENKLKITTELFYDLEQAGIIYVDQENWSYAPKQAQKLSKMAEKWMLIVPILKELVFKFREDKSLGSYEVHLYEQIESLINGGVRTQ